MNARLLEGCPFCSLIQEDRVGESYSDEIVQFAPLNRVTPGHFIEDSEDSEDSEDDHG